MTKKAIIVIGAGDATGGAIAQRFAREGYVACVARRNADKLTPLVERIKAEGGQVEPFGTDARREEQVQQLFETVENNIGPVEVCVLTPVATLSFRLTTRPLGCITRSGKWVALPGF